jgi:hypothetical protein
MSKPKNAAMPSTRDGAPMKARAPKVLAFPVAPKFPPVPPGTRRSVRRSNSSERPDWVELLNDNAAMCLKTFRKMARMGMPLDRWRAFQEQQRWETEQEWQKRKRAIDEAGYEEDDR